MKIRSIKIKITCRVCKQKHKIFCTQESYDKWHHGEELIEDALYYLNDGERTLISTKVCSNCAGVLK